MKASEQLLSISVLSLHFYSVFISLTMVTTILFADEKMINSRHVTTSVLSEAAYHVERAGKIK